MLQGDGLSERPERVQVLAPVPCWTVFRGLSRPGSLGVDGSLAAALPTASTSQGWVRLDSLRFVKSRRVLPAVRLSVVRLAHLPSALCVLGVEFTTRVNVQWQVFRAGKEMNWGPGRG